jgi:ferredoxin
MSADITITVIDRAGDEHQYEIPTDMALNLMEVCKMNDLDVEGTCGGMALCASCQVYVISKHDLDYPSDDEEAMLDQAFHVKDNSRLGCQIKMTATINGLKVQLAPK